ncbi:hypothetical protein [Streptomyces sp. NPDC001985]|uniref:hypothetical protein n=1 Tax=Streptomyces sp. NPDC001985 TaxID=3154406 RepID=UPI00331C8D8B
MHQKPDTGTDHKEERERRIDLSLPQVAGSTLAAVAAAVLASSLGVYGTIIGAGVVSVVATCGGSVFQHLFSRTGEQLREREAVVPGRRGGRRAAGPAGSPEPGGESGATAPAGEFGAATVHGTRVRGWKRPLIAAGAVFGIAMVTITGLELASGSELSGGNGTTVGSVVRGETGRSGPADERSPGPGEREDERPGSPGGSPRPGDSGDGNGDTGDDGNGDTGDENGERGRESGEPVEPSSPGGSGGGTADPSTAPSLPGGETGERPGSGGESPGGGTAPVPTPSAPAAPSAPGGATDGTNRGASTAP